MTAVTLAHLESEHPEWSSWLDVIRAVHCELGESVWQLDTLAPQTATATRDPSEPFLAHPTALPAASQVERLLRELLRRAGTAAAVQSCGNRAPRIDEPIAMAAFRAGLAGRQDSIRGAAAAAGVDEAFFNAIASLLPMPWLHAVRRSFSKSMPQSWQSGYCPCCGGWPTLAQVCGIERARYLRCVRCGTAWPTAVLSCPFCGTTDHEHLGSLVVESDQDRRAVEVCNACKGYVKSLRSLALGAPEDLLLEDLASVELDIAAAHRSYQRPAGSGCAMTWLS